MTQYFVTRHRAAKEWAKSQGIDAIHIEHLDKDIIIGKGDTIIGTLPIHLAAEICDKGADFVYLEMDIPAEMRGKELTKEDMEKCNARLRSYVVRETSK